MRGLLYTSSMLSYNHRFHGHNSLRFVYKNGKTVRSQMVVLKYAVNPKRKNSRFAVVVSKKTMKSAIGRNRIRRRVYELLRKHLENIKENSDVVLLVVSAEVRTMPASELERSIIEALTQAQIYKTPVEAAIL